MNGAGAPRLLFFHIFWEKLSLTLCVGECTRRCTHFGIVRTVTPLPPGLSSNPKHHMPRLTLVLFQGLWSPQDGLGLCLPQITLKAQPPPCPFGADASQCHRTKCVSALSCSILVSEIPRGSLQGTSGF